MAIPLKVDSSSGYASTQLTDYHKNLPHTKSCHLTALRNKTPEARLCKNHRHALLQLLWPRKWPSPKHWRGMVHRWEWFYDRRNKAGGINRNLPDPGPRSKKPIPRAFCPKGTADSLHLSLKDQDREDLKCIHRLLVAIHHPTCDCYSLANIWTTYVRTYLKSSDVLCLQKVRQIVVAQGYASLGLRPTNLSKGSWGEALLLHLGPWWHLNPAVNGFLHPSVPLKKKKQLKRQRRGLSPAKPINNSQENITSA